QAEEADVTGAEPELTKSKEEDIRMNQPLKFDGYALYQAGYQLDELSELSFIIHETDDDDKKPLAKFTIDELMYPESTYELDNGFRVENVHYYPDDVLEDGKPRSESKYPRTPAYVFALYPTNNETR